MNEWSTKNHSGEESTGGGTSQFITYGRQKLVITGFEIKTAQTGSQMVKFKMESAPLDVSGFTPHDDSKNGGQIGNIQASSWMKTNDQKSQFNENISIICNKLGVKEAADNIEASSLEDYMSKLMPLISNKPMWWLVVAEEYLGQDAEGNDKIKYSLKLARYGFVASLEEGEEHIDSFDKSNKYHYKKLEEQPSTPADAASSTWT